MKYYGKAEASAKRILSLFESGDVPAALAPVFVRRKDDIPCRKWSWSNQLLTALAGHDDARGFRQWQAVDRFVKKGEHGFPILVPIHVKKEARDADTGEPKTKLALVGFKAQIVFGHSQTDGKPLEIDRKAEQFIESLPLVEVAKAWGISVNTYNGNTRGPLGRFRFNAFGADGGSIALGVENLSTWAHEMMHAADRRLGTLTESGQHWRSEIVAELGGAILLHCMGFDRDADAGGCWEYLSRYARDADIEPIAACQRVLKRTCDAVTLILTEYDQVTNGTPVESAEAA